MTVYVKLPSNSGHLSITDKKTRRCPLFWGFIVLSLVFVYNFDLTEQLFRTASYKDSKRKNLGGGGGVDKLGLNVSIDHENICWIVLKRLRWWHLAKTGASC